MGSTAAAANDAEVAERRGLAASIVKLFPHRVTSVRGAQLLQRGHVAARSSSRRPQLELGGQEAMAKVSVVGERAKRGVDEGEDVESL